MLLEISSSFYGLTVIEDLTENHHGEREVFLMADSEGAKHVVTVFNLDSGRYATRKEGSAAELVDEIRLRSSIRLPELPGAEDAQLAMTGGGVRLAWYSVPYFEGCKLIDMINCDSPFDPATALSIINNICSAIIILGTHTDGGGHYNLNPGNILVSEDNRVLITGTTYASGSISGNPAFPTGGIDRLFRAPETFRGLFSTSSDVCSMGLLLATMVLGRYPREVDASPEISDRDFVHNLLASRRKDVKLRESLSGNIYAIFVQSTIPDKNLRTTVHQFRAALKKAGAQDHSCSPVSAGRQDSSAPTSCGTSTRCTARHPGVAATADPAIRRAGGGLDQVAGMAGLKSLLRRNFVEIIKNRELAKKFGIKPPNGILLYGAPGCGKTFVAEKAAQESGLNYRIISPGELGSIYVHGTQTKIAEAFEQARKNAPMILILDEFDAMAPKRCEGDPGNQANEVNEFLTQLNNCADSGVYVMMTSNFPTALDAAVTRRGRLDEKIYVGLPDADARRELFALELKDKPCSDDIDTTRLAEATADYNCADISYIVKETARKCFEEAVAGADENTSAISQAKLLATIKNTVPSVSPEQIRGYEKIREQFESRDGRSGRPSLGFKYQS